MIIPPLNGTFITEETEKNELVGAELREEKLRLNKNSLSVIHMKSFSLHIIF